MTVPGGESSRDRRPERGRDRSTSASPEASVRFEAILIALATTLVVGAYLVLWAGAHDRLDNDTFTEWHVPAYAALIGLILFIVFSADRAMRRGQTWRAALPAGYDSVVLGVGLLAIYPFVDLLATAPSGRLEGLTGGLAVSRLLIPAGLVLIVAGPLRSARRRSKDRERISRLRQMPAILAAGLMLASLSIPVLPLSPFVETPAAAAPPEREDAAVRADRASGIRTLSLDGKTQVRLANAFGIQEAAWSPDGEMIAYANFGEIEVMGASGTGQRSLGSSREQAGWISWSPDSKRIVYMSAVSNDREASPPPVAAPAPGPGEAAVGRTSGNEHDVFVRDVAGGEPIRLTDAPGTDGGPSWSPDGSTIVFHSERSGDLEIWSIPAVGGEATRLTDAPGYDLSPSWNPDGTRITFSSERGGDFAIWSMAPDGSDPRQLTDIEGDEWMPGWSSDGQTMSFMCSSPDGPGEVCTMDLASGVVTRLTDDDRFMTDLSSEPWSPDGTTLVYSSRLLLPDEVADTGDAFDVARLLLAIVAVAAVLLTAWHVGLWATGMAFVVFVLPVALVAAVEDELRFLPAIVVAGLAVEGVALALRPWNGTRRRVRTIAVVAPVAWIAAYFATLALGDDLRWGPDLAAGVAICCGAIGLLLVQLILTPSNVDPG